MSVSTSEPELPAASLEAASEPPTGFSWPPSTSLIRHIAFSSALGELSYGAEPFAQTLGLEWRLSQTPSVPSPKTTRPHVWNLYQTGRHGPQNGSLLAIISPGVDIIQCGKEVESQIGDQIGQSTYGLLVKDEFGPLSIRQDVLDGEEGAAELQRILIDELISSTALNTIHLTDEGELGGATLKEMHPHGLPAEFWGKGLFFVVAGGQGDEQQLHHRQLCALVKSARVMRLEWLIRDVPRAICSIMARASDRQNVGVLVCVPDGNFLLYDGVSGLPQKWSP